MEQNQKNKAFKKSTVVATLAILGATGLATAYMSGGAGLFSRFTGDTTVTARNAASLWQASDENPFRTRVREDYRTRLDTVTTAILRKGSNMTDDQFKNYLTNLSNGVRELGKKPNYANDTDVQNILGYITHETDLTTSMIGKSRSTNNNSYSAANPFTQTSTYSSSDNGGGGGGGGGSNGNSQSNNNSSNTTSSALNDCSFGGKVYYPTRTGNPYIVRVGASAAKFDVRYETTHFSPAQSGFNQSGKRGYVPNLELAIPDGTISGLGVAANGTKSLTSAVLNLQFADGDNPANGIAANGGLQIEGDFRTAQSFIRNCWIQAFNQDTEATDIAAKELLQGREYIKQGFIFNHATGNYEPDASQCYGSIEQAYACDGVIANNVEYGNGRTLERGPMRYMGRIVKFTNGAICTNGGSGGMNGNTEGFANVAAYGTTNGNLNFISSVLQDTNICRPIFECKGEIEQQYQCDGVIATNVPATVMQPWSGIGAAFNNTPVPRENITANGVMTLYKNGAICNGDGFEARGYGFTNGVMNFDTKVIEKGICRPLNQTPSSGGANQPTSTDTNSQSPSSSVNDTTTNSANNSSTQTNTSSVSTEQCASVPTKDFEYYEEISGTKEYYVSGSGWCSRNKDGTGVTALTSLPADLFTNGNTYRLLDYKTFNKNGRSSVSTASEQSVGTQGMTSDNQP